MAAGVSACTAVNDLQDPMGTSSCASIANQNCVTASALSGRPLHSHRTLGGAVTAVALARCPSFVTPRFTSGTSRVTRARQPRTREVLAVIQFRNHRGRALRLVLALALLILSLSIVSSIRLQHLTRYGAGVHRSSRRSRRPQILSYGWTVLTRSPSRMMGRPSLAHAKMPPFRL